MSNNDADDVLDFINSLPDPKSTPKAPGNAKVESSDDFKDFLDELSAHEKAGKGLTRSKLEPKKRDELMESRRSLSAKVLGPPTRRAVPSAVPELKASAVITPPSALPTPTQTSETPGTNPRPPFPQEPEKEATVDPISSISLWWNTEGLSKVLSLWGLLASNASHFGETTFQLASNTSQQLSHQKHKFLTENQGLEAEQISHITGKLNLILSTVSQQIKEGLINKDDEILNIFLVCDWQNTAEFDALCAPKFEAVMDQIEGGVSVTVSNFNHKHENFDSAKGSHYDLGMFHGKAIDGEKLCFANLENSINEYLKIQESQNEQKKADGQQKDNEKAEIATSNVFIAIQPICTGQQPVTPIPESNEPSATTAASSSSSSTSLVFIEANNANSFAFTLILKDITNNITIVSKSQPFPVRWARWLAGQSKDVDAIFSAEDGESGVDPSDWVNGWVKNGLELSFAVLAQEYIINRMGIY